LRDLGSAFVATDESAYRSARDPVLLTVIGAVTWSPGAMAANVMSAVVGLVVRTTVPVENVFASTVAELVKSGGRVATTMGSADVEGLAARGVRGSNVFAQSDPAHFVRLLQIAGEGALTVPVTRTFSLHNLHEGLELLGTGHARGKYVVTLES